MIKADSIKELYLTNLISGPDIAKKLDVNIRWVYRSLERRGIKRRTSAIQNRINFEKSSLSFNFKKKLSPLDRELLVAGSMLYYGEGAKTGKTVDFANSDPQMLKVFIKFLRDICRVNEKKFRFYLYCFSNQNQEYLISYWCKTLKVSRRQFTKPYIRDANPNSTRTMNYGLLHIRYSDIRLLSKILSINSELTNKLLKTGGVVE